MSDYCYFIDTVRVKVVRRKTRHLAGDAPDTVRFEAAIEDPPDRMWSLWPNAGLYGDAVKWTSCFITPNDVVEAYRKHTIQMATEAREIAGRAADAASKARELAAMFRT